MVYLVYSYIVFDIVTIIQGWRYIAKITANPDEINIGDSGEESGGEEESQAVQEVPLRLERQAIPLAVFGSIPEDMQGEVLGEKEVLGAKERFAKKK